MLSDSSVSASAGCLIRNGGPAFFEKNPDERVVASAKHSATGAQVFCDR